MKKFDVAKSMISMLALAVLLVSCGTHDSPVNPAHEPFFEEGIELDLELFSAIGDTIVLPITHTDSLIDFMINIPDVILSMYGPDETIYMEAVLDDPFPVGAPAPGGAVFGSLTIFPSGYAPPPPSANPQKECVTCNTGGKEGVANCVAAAVKKAIGDGSKSVKITYEPIKFLGVQTGSKVCWE